MKSDFCTFLDKTLKGDHLTLSYSPCYFLYIFCVSSWENFIKVQDILSLVISSFILVTCLFDQVVIL